MLGKTIAHGLHVLCEHRIQFVITALGLAHGGVHLLTYIALPVFIVAALHLAGATPASTRNWR